MMTIECIYKCTMVAFVDPKRPIFYSDPSFFFFLVCKIHTMNPDSNLTLGVGTYFLIFYPSLIWPFELFIWDSLGCLMVYNWWTLWWWIPLACYSTTAFRILLSVWAPKPFIMPWSSATAAVAGTIVKSLFTLLFFLLLLFYGHIC